MLKRINSYFIFVAVQLLLVFHVFAQPARGQSAAPVVRENVLSDASRVMLEANVHPLAVRANDRGAAPDNLPMTRMLLQLRRNADKEAALEKLLEAQQTQGSIAYHQWLTPKEFGAQFGPSDQEVSQVTAWLASQGFQVSRVSAGKTIVEFSGTHAQVRSAFQTEIHKYVVGGKEYWANNQNPSIPATLARTVSGIVSLNNIPTPAQRRALAALSGAASSGSIGSSGKRPEFSYPGSQCTSTGNCYAVTPPDFATIYDIGPLWTAGTDGTGQTIAIASGSNIRPTDVQNFRTLFNLPNNNPIIFVDGTDPGIVTGEELEANFSVQWAGAVAKNATVELVVAQSTPTSRGTDLAALYAVDNNVAPVLTENLSVCEDDLGSSGTVFYSSLWQQAAVEGITVIIPTGDTGSAACDSSSTEVAAQNGIAVNGVASTAYNVAVGGTDFNQVGNWSQYWNATDDPNTFASAKSYIPETTWNDTCTENGVNGCQTVSPSGSDLIAGGGGLSKYTQTPVWQTVGSFPLQGARGIPDLSMFAGDGNNGSYYVMCEEDAQSAAGCNLNSPYQAFTTLGGTTGAAATFAGIMALVNQQAGGPQGNVNYIIYPLAQSTSLNIFHDVTLGSISVACVAGTPFCSNTGTTGYGFLGDASNALWSAFTGYDLATGWGSVDANNLVTNWTSNARATSVTTLSGFSPLTLGVGQTVNFTIQVAPFNGTATPTGDVALMVTPPSGNPYAIAVFTLQGGTITGSTALLPGGSYQIFARYGGDGSFAPSVSSPIAIDVASIASQMVLAAYAGVSLPCVNNNNEYPYGSGYIIYGIVNTSGNPCSGVGNSSALPTGTVTVTDFVFPTGTVTIGTFTLNSRAHFVDAAASLVPGSHNLTGVYSGDASYQPSTSAPFNIIIDPGRTHVNLTATSTTVVVGTSVTITATVSTTSIAAAPTGQITFSTTKGVLGVVNLFPGGFDPQGNVQSLATLTLTPATTGNLIITASYGGDNNYLNNFSQPITITAGSSDFETVAAPNPLVITAGQTGAATLTLTPVFGYTGTITLACPSSLPPGVTCAISPSTVTLGSSGTPGTANVTITTTAPSVIPNQFALAAPVRPMRALAAIAALFLSPFVFLPGGRRRRRALLISTAAGVLFFVASCSSSVQNNSTTALTVSSSGSKMAQGSPLTLRAFVSAPQTVNGAVSFQDSGVLLGQPAILNGGRANLTLSNLAVGTHSITASYSGDANTPALTTASPFFQTITGQVPLQISVTSGKASHPLNLQVTLQ